ncbi:MAG TPA: PLP-dependent aminotransferase family protein [Bordetella sp.]|nr:PLP-dependent aminotransferase family protein [Bordetella sp.]
MKLARETEFFWTNLCRLRHDSAVTLQAQIRESVVQAILDRRLLPGAPMPATRTLARVLGVSRNTMLLAYERLVEEGYLASEARSGHSVGVQGAAAAGQVGAPPALQGLAQFDWAAHLRPSLADLPQLYKPQDWQRYPYPFVFGQFDATLFPASDWREASQLAMRKMAVRDWAGDSTDRDDTLLIRQIQARVLRRRGISVSPDEILITLGAQHAMFLVGGLMFRHARCVGLEDPGYPDLKNLCRFFSVPMRGVAMGPGFGAKLDGCDYVFVCPSHQNPSGRTMSLMERIELLQAATRSNFIVVEDDYDSELSFEGGSTPSIKALDTSGRVIYIGSLSKTVAAGLRIGYLVAPAALIREARVLRRLMLRHPPANNQRTAALFLSLGHYDALLPRLVKAYRERAQILCHALARHMPQVEFEPPRGGSALWLRAPDGVDMGTVRERARAEGVLFDAGADFYLAAKAPRNYFRLGYSSIAAEQIEPGIRVLAGCLREVMAQGPRKR